MANLFKASLFADTARWNATAVVNVVHFQSGWNTFEAVPLPVASMSRSGIETWGDLVNTVGMAIGYGSLQIVANLLSHVIAMLLIYVWCHDSLRLYNEAKHAWQGIKSRKETALHRGLLEISVQSYNDHGSNI